MMLQSLLAHRLPGILGQLTLQPAGRLAKPAGDLVQGLVVGIGRPNGVRGHGAALLYRAPETR